MSGLSGFARQAFGREKPHSSITDWVEILTSSNFEEEAYDGIPELVDSINLQAAGPAEASRALRKKLKHGSPHQQYRALVLLKALVENCGHKFQTSFADGQLTDTLKNIAADSLVDRRVNKKLLLILLSWHDQFKADPDMQLVASLYKQCKAEKYNPNDLSTVVGSDAKEVKKKAEREEAKNKARKEKEEAKEKRRKEEEERRQRERSGGNKLKRAPFDFERDKPKVLASIVDASQASSNLVNAITLVNLQTDSLLTNDRVQECLEKAKQANKVVVRYIQLVENEELIGTLIETNERVIAAIELYDQLAAQKAGSAADPTSVLSAGLATARISGHEIDSTVQQSKDPRGIKGKEQDDNLHLHPDLHDLSFGPIGVSSNKLPPPLRPSTVADDTNGQDDHTYDARGSLSDFSDYESSDEETHNVRSSPKRRNYVDVSDGPDDEHNFMEHRAARAPLVHEEGDDPFADPFADNAGTGPSKKW